MLTNRVYGDQLVLQVLGHSLGLKVTVVDAATLCESRMFHQDRLENVDIVVVHVPELHYVATRKFWGIHFQRGPCFLLNFLGSPSIVTIFSGTLAQTRRHNPVPPSVPVHFVTLGPGFVKDDVYPRYTHGIVDESALRQNPSMVFDVPAPLSKCGV